MQAKCFQVFCGKVLVPEEKSQRIWTVAYRKGFLDWQKTAGKGDRFKVYGQTYIVKTFNRFDIDHNKR